MSTSFLRDQIEKWFLPLGFLFVAWLKWPGAFLAYSQGKWLALVLLALVATGLAIWRGPRLPRMQIWEGVFFGLALAGGIAQTIYFRPVGFEFTVMDRWSFAVLALAAWYAFRSGKLRLEDFWWPVAIAVTVVSAIGLVQMWEIGFPGEMPYTKVGSTFGFANNTAQFLGVALLLWWALPKPRLPVWVLPMLSAFSLTYFFLLRGRSTLIGFGLGLAVLAALRFRKEGKRLLRNRGLWAAAAIALVLFGGFQLARGKSAAELFRLSILSEKSSMVTFRGDVWRQTIELIKARPFGIGPDRFTFQFIPFYSRGIGTLSEGVVVDTPHNEFLRYPAEDGVVLALLYLAALLYVVARWLRLGRDWELWLPAFAFLAVEMAAQFPFSNPFPPYVLALFLGYAGAQIWRDEVRLPLRWARGVVLAIGVLQLFFTAKVVAARTLERSDDLAEAKLSCRLVPHNWYSCLTVTRIQLEQGNLGEARAYAEDILFPDAWNYTAMRYLSIVAFKEGSKLEGCYYLWKYDHIFHDHSSIHDRLAPNCQAKWIDYFERKQPPAFLPRLEAYLDQQKGRSAWSTTFRFWE